MLHPQTPFPCVGSYALLIDYDAEPHQAAELVRIQWRRDYHAMVSFPLRDGASGNKVVDLVSLIDASPLTSAETREFHDLDRDLIGREPRNFSKAQRAKKVRRDQLKQRIIYGPILDRQLRFVRARTEPQQWAA